MRPAELSPLFASARSLTGVGPRVEEMLRKAVRLPPGVTETRVVDLLWHTPTGIVDRRSAPTIASAVPGTIVTLEVRVLRHRPSPRGNTRAPYKVQVEDDSGRLDIVFFHAERRFVEAQLPVGETRFVSGRIERYNDNTQMTHPDYIVAPDKRDDLPMLEPVYPLTAGLSGKVLSKICRRAVERLPRLPEWQDPAWMKSQAWPAFHDAVVALHKPQDAGDVSNGSPFWQRLAYDELLAGQLALGLVRQKQKVQPGRRVSGDGRIRARIADALPFALTGAQRRALADIAADMNAPHRMLRLLQGDVGSGKTVVALMTMAMAVEAGGQAALMAPPEVLARQHVETIAPLAEKAGLRLAILTGREKGKARELVLRHLAAGEIDIVIGTHALFQPDVHFHDLGVAVIDEQHRFGVMQRLALRQKGDLNPDVLVMTATPIPRTLTLAFYGHLDVSVIDELPPGRQAIKTYWKLPYERAKVYEGVRKVIAEGKQAYFVCPMISESEKMQTQAAEDLYYRLSTEVYPDLRVGLLHGQMKPDAKEDVMLKFRAGELDVLVSTVVIEVGVDVPNAIAMVIEDANRFGLAQLHQLRGRVGRGSDQSYCVLVAEAKTEEARARLETMVATTDGFKIAEQDLRLRGPGQLMGTMQHGNLDLKIADLVKDARMIEVARDCSEWLLQIDLHLQLPEHQGILSQVQEHPVDKTLLTVS